MTTRLCRAACKLFVEHLTAADRAFLQDADGGHIGQRLTQREIGVWHPAGLAVEQVEGADGLAAQSQRDRVHRCETPAADDGGHEPRPPIRGLRQVGDPDLGRGPISLQTRPLGGLQLQQLHSLCVLAGGRDRAQLLTGIGEQDPCGVRGQQRHAMGDELVEQVDDVVVVDQGVGERHERLTDPLFTLGLDHHGPPPDRMPASVYVISSVNTSRRSTTSRATSSNNR